VKTASSEQIGSALRGLAADLVAARQRVALLERENRELRSRIETLERAVAARGDQDERIMLSAAASVCRGP
jgi:prefoldin subunit 5